MTYNPVVHFEMPYEDIERLKKFYQDSFGWTMHDTPPELSGYVVAHTAETDEKNMVKTPGTINGGFFKRNSPGVAPNVVIAVEDIAAALEKIKAAGATDVDGPMDIPGIGSYVTFNDSEGNRVSMLQPKGM